MKLWTFGTLLLAAALATGCIAQVGQGTEDPGTSPETLTGEQAAPATAPAQLDKNQLRVIRPAAEGKLELQGQGQELRVGPGVDPGAPVQDDGDGREPDPHPWHTPAP